ncbi:MAG TPA: hypothetical protein VHO06_12560 [Polyangia bacterium]|nr:hypothetical protein [Polyangia bacterium]
MKAATDFRAGLAEAALKLRAAIAAAPPAGFGCDGRALGSPGETVRVATISCGYQRQLGLDLIFNEAGAARLSLRVWDDAGQPMKGLGFVLLAPRLIAFAKAITQVLDELTKRANKETR